MAVTIKKKDKLENHSLSFLILWYTKGVINMKKIKRELKQIIDFFKGIRISTIYKLVGLLLLAGIVIWIFSTLNKSEKMTDTKNVVLTGTIVNKGEDYIIVKDSSNNEYKIPVQEEEKYPIGSDVNANVGSVIEIGRAHV